VALSAAFSVRQPGNDIGIDREAATSAPQDADRTAAIHSIRKEVSELVIVINALAGRHMGVETLR
jgi:hypothetical protein